jgi:tetratricopeptide (TPR) repeat protein
VSSAEHIRDLRKQGDHEAARRLAAELAAHDPNDAELQYEAACVHDHLGEEAAAVRFYRAAMAAGLAGEQLRGAYLGLGSTCRALGRYEEALATFEDGMRKFADAPELTVFRAMALYNAGRSKEAVASLLNMLAHTSDDQAIQRYRRAILLYSQDLDRRWE